jgi:uncharacterized protein YqgV (UPF0045/DUF77 family)
MTDKTLAEKLAKVILELPGFTKDGRNTHQNYQFISIEQMKKTIIPALAAEGIVCYPHDVRETVNHRDRGSELFVVMKWIITDGKEILTPYPETIGQAADTQDKSGSKGTTDALKNLFKTTFGVYEKDDDNDRNTPYPDDSYRPAPPPVNTALENKLDEAGEVIKKLAKQFVLPPKEIIQVMIDDEKIPAAWEQSSAMKTVAEVQEFIDAAKTYLDSDK